MVFATEIGRGVVNGDDWYMRQGQVAVKSQKLFPAFTRADSYKQYKNSTNNLQRTTRHSEIMISILRAVLQSARPLV